MTTRASPLLIDSYAASEFLGLTSQSLRLHRMRNTGPDYVRVSVACIRYRVVDLERWIDGLVVGGSQPIVADAELRLWVTRLLGYDEFATRCDCGDTVACVFCVLRSLVGGEVPDPDTTPAD